MPNIVPISTKLLNFYMDAFQIVKESDSSQLWHHVESKFQRWTAIVVPSDAHANRWMSVVLL